MAYIIFGVKVNFKRHYLFFKYINKKYNNLSVNLLSVSELMSGIGSK